MEGGLQGSFALSRATAESVRSDDITVADMIVWELSLSFVFGLETCSGRYKVRRVCIFRAYPQTARKDKEKKRLCLSVSVK